MPAPLVTPDSRDSEGGSHQDTAIEIRRRLLATEGVSVSRLVVRPVQDGVCLEGIVTVDCAEFDIRSILRGIVGTGNVTDRLLICRDPQDCHGSEE